MLNKVVKLKDVSRPRLFPITLGATAYGWHQIEPFTICPKEYQYRRIRGIQQRAPFLAEPLAVGLLLHAARAQWFYDKRKGDTWREAMLEYRRLEEAEGVRMAPSALHTAVLTFEAYVDYWSIRPKPEVLAIEHEIKPRALVKDAPQWSWRGARLDSVERWRGKTWVGELKSTTSAPSRVTDIYTLNGQTLLQAALWGEEETKKFGPLGGILLDIMVKPTGKKKARAVPRVPLHIDQMQHALKWFRKDFSTWVMQSSLIDWNASVERRPVCMRTYGPCDFRSMCLRGRAGSNAFVLRDGTPVSAWQPSPGKEVPPWD